MVWMTSQYVKVFGNVRHLSWMLVSCHRVYPAPSKSASNRKPAPEGAGFGNAMKLKPKAYAAWSFFLPMNWAAAEMKPAAPRPTSAPQIV